MNLFQLGSKESVCLPEPVGQVVQMTEKLYVPVKDNPDVSELGSTARLAGRSVNVAVGLSVQLRRPYSRATWHDRQAA